MSGVLKAIGKVFKKISKIALPVIAIAGVALTGGAALGLFGAGGMGGALASLGIAKGSALAGILTTAAKGATFGAIGGALTGGNPLKGATTGLIAGGMLGGVNLAMGGAQAATGAASSAAPGAQTGVQAGADLSLGQFSDAARAAVQSVPQAATSGIGSALADVGSTVGGIFKNPITAGMAIQGIGAGLSASSQAAAVRRQEEQTRENYSTYGGLGTAPTTAAAYIGIDPATGRIINRGA